MAFGFTVDPDNVFGKFVEESGDYNVKVASVSEPQHSKAGNDYLTIDYELLDGTYKGAQIRYQNLTYDESTQEKKDLSDTRFNTMVVSAGAKVGFKFTSMEQFAKAVTGKKLNVHTKWGAPNNKGKIYLTVDGFNPLDKDGSKPDGIKRPAQSNVTDGGFGGKQSNANTSDPFANNGQPIDVSDDDLPF